MSPFKAKRPATRSYAAQKKTAVEVLTDSFADEAFS